MKLVLAGAQGKRCRRCAREAKHRRRTSEPSGESKREKKQRKAEFGVGRGAIYHIPTRIPHLPASQALECFITPGHGRVVISSPTTQPT